MGLWSYISFEDYSWCNSPGKYKALLRCHLGQHTIGPGEPSPPGSPVFPGDP